jgi:hypothetical protein
LCGDFSDLMSRTDRRQGIPPLHSSKSRVKPAIFRGLLFFARPKAVKQHGRQAGQETLGE